MAWIARTLVTFFAISLKIAVTAAECNEPGYLDTFTFVPNKLISGYNLFYRTINGDKATLQRACEALCLAEPRCASYEIDSDYNDCYVSAHTMYDVPLSSASEYDFYNRNFDCGCPPSQHCTVLSNHTGTNDGSVLSYSCANGTRHPSLPKDITCTSAGWGVAENDFFCAEHSCGAPPKVNFSSVTSYDFFLPGQKVMYTCFMGYVISGSSTSTKTIVCLDDGTWDTPPSCTNTCADPPTVTNAVRTESDGYTIGSNVTYTCESGYVIAGTTTNIATISCMSDQQWEPEPSCIVICGRPPSVQNGYHNSGSMVHQVGDSVTVSCSSGYVVKGKEQNQTSIQCNRDGTWDEAPNCIINCGPPPSVQYASVTSGDVFTPGQKVTYTCDTRYAVPGSNNNVTSITCQEDGMWETAPTCKISCGAPAGISNGAVTEGSIFTHGEEVRYACDEGYVIQGTILSTSDSTCQADGSWSVTPICIRNCGPPPSVIFSSHDGTGDVFVPNDEVTYTCNSNYVIKGKEHNTTKLQCLSNGKWQDTPICDVNCGPPPSVQYASVTSGDVFTPGQKVTYTCDTRYAVPGSNTNVTSITCQEDGMWETAPTCKISCGAPAGISNGAVTEGSIFTHGEEVRYACDEGYVIQGTKLSTSDSTCQADGSWSVTPICIRNCGPPPSVIFSSHDGTVDVFVPNDEVTYTCNSNYVIKGTEVNKTKLQCLSNGKWQDTPICDVNCGPPPAVENATVTPGTVFTPGQTVTYRCDSMFVIPMTKINTATIACREGGRWEQEPTCKVNCGSPQTISNGAVTSGDTFTPREEVTYTCNESYVIRGTKLSKSKSTCQEDGSWSVTPTCVENCGPPPTLPHSTHNGIGTVFVPNDRVTYTCDINFVIKDTLLAQATVQCQGSGLWQESPICIVNCGPPPSVHYATKTSGNVFTPGQTITYTCNTQYVIPELKVNITTIACGEDGAWKQPPTCQVNCGKPAEISNGAVSAGSVFTQGEEVTYMCDESYVISGTKLSSSKSTCQSDGSWSSTPSCIRNCGPSPTALHSTNNGVGNVFVPDEEVTYTCDTNYVIKSTRLKQAKIRCQASGTWQETPICTVNCGPPDVATHASRSPSGTIFTPGDIVTWTCQDRYVVQETNLQRAQVVCQDSGVWTNKPDCIAYCGEHPKVDHTVVNGTGSQKANKRTYSCIAGHTLVGRSDIECLDNSEWETPPMCPADCGDPPSLRNGILHGSGNLENSTRDITCNDGYVLVGATSIMCLPNGQWEPLPACQASEVNALQNHMFGASKRPISTETTIAMVFAILFFICLLAACVAHIYMRMKKRKQKRDQEMSKDKSSSQNGRKSNPLDSGHANTLFNTNTPDPDYDSPIPRNLQGDRSWRDLLF